MPAGRIAFRVGQTIPSQSAWGQQTPNFTIADNDIAGVSSTIGMRRGVGCQLSDWVGRLLTRMASKSRLSLESKQFFIVGESVTRSPALTRFFQTFGGGTRVQVLDLDPSVFVAELSER